MPDDNKPELGVMYVCYQHNCGLDEAERLFHKRFGYFPERVFPVRMGHHEVGIFAGPVRGIDFDISCIPADAEITSITLNIKR